jgi:hypothetical protein
MAKRDYNVDIDVNNNDLLNVDSLALNTSTTDAGGVGKIWWNSDNETLNIGLDAAVTLDVGQEHVIRVKNSSGVTAIPKMRAVVFAGATGDTVTVSPAISTATYEPYTIVGITTEEIPADGFGFVTQFGFISNVDTSTPGWTLGDLLYINPAVAGGLTNVPPSAPNWTFPVAAVTRVHASTGRILVRTIPGGHLHDIVDVAITTPANGQVLKYDDGVWVNSLDATGVAIQPEPPENTDVLWLDTDAPSGESSSSIGVLALKPRSGEYIRVSASNSSINANLNMVYYSPIFIPETTTFDRITVRTGGSFSGSGVVRIGIYNNDSTKDEPSTVVLDAGTVATSAANTNYEITINQSLNAGIYWLAFVSQTNAATNNYFSALTPTFQYTVGTSAANLGQQLGFTQSSVSGAFATAGTLTRQNNCAQVVLRKA